jgi:hypothetical protein
MATLDTVSSRPSGASHAAGKAYFETSTNKFIVWNGSQWIELHSDGTGAVFRNQWGAHFNTTWSAQASISSYDVLYTGYVPTAGYNLSISWWFKGTTSGVDRSLSPVWGNTSVGFYAPGILMSATNNGGSIVGGWNKNGGQGGGTTGWGWGGDGTYSTFVDGNWHHFVYVVSEVIGQNVTSVKLYMDGSEFADHTSTSSDMYTVPYTNNSFQTQYVIGGLSNTNKWLFGDYIDDVAFFESNITAEQVTDLYNGGKPGDVSSLDPKCWLRFGDHESDSPTAGGSIASVTDSSTYNNTVTTSASTQPLFLDLTGETIYA